MEEDTAAFGLKQQHQNRRRAGVLAWAAICVTVAGVATATPKHFELEAGDARVMLDEFSRQADLQLLFDFTQLKGMKTSPVSGDLEPQDALQQMLRGIPIQWSWVNDTTLAITVRKGKDAAQNPGGARHWWQRSSGPTKTGSKSPTDDALAQVLVSADNSTSGNPPIGASLIRLTRQDIERSGYATVSDFVHTLPQVFGGGPSEDTQLGREAVTNPTKGSGINLRGLDAGATLVLIDGVRIAPGGAVGLYTDISNIPLTAIDHVDILPDGASAQYGADAIGGVANFVLRSDVTGAETQLRNGTITGGIGDQRYSQLFGLQWGSGHGTFGFEYYNRDAIPAADRYRATSDLRAWGGTNFDTPFGSPGTIQIGQQTWAIPKNLTGSVTSADLVPGTVNLYDPYSGADVLPQQKRWSAFATVRHELGDNLTLFADSTFSSRSVKGSAPSELPSALIVTNSNPFYLNPTGATNPITVLYGPRGEFGSFTVNDDVNFAAFSTGVTFNATNDWRITGRVDYTFDKEHTSDAGLADPTALNSALSDTDPNTAFDPFAPFTTNPQTLRSIAATGLGSTNSNLAIAGLTASGPVIQLPGGAARFTVGTEYRRQRFDAATEEVGAGGTIQSTSSDLRRTIRSAFAELQIPLLSPDNSVRFARRLEVSLGGRTEDYSDVGRASIPKFGLLWAADENFSLRGTWTKAFRPPTLADVIAANSASGVYRIPDPSSLSGSSSVLIASGTNPELNQERARTWTVGAEISPHTLSGLSAAITYFDTFYSGRIEQVILEPNVLADPTLAWLVNRNFTTDERQDICGTTTFKTAGNCLTSDVSAIVDNRLHNVEHIETRGIDVLAKYALPTSIGSFEAALNGTYLLDYSEAKTPGSPTLSLLNTPTNPINLRMRGSLSWQRGGLGTSLYVNFDNGYRDIVSVPNRNVRSWTTFDLQLRYRTDQEDLGLLSNVELAISAQNVFNSSPPFYNNPLGIGYDEENADLLGRLVSFDIRKRW
ncbi:MAG TPA: TonB-dependent receptor [Steroidobacteraceae bacterium]|jgi:outer membrane receptor protein involved in Fe transport